jgi:putative heme-binding domain-containing protein
LKRSSIQAASTPARAHSLWLLDGLAQLDRDVVLAALHDTEPRVVEQAVRLAEARFPADEAIAERVLAVARTTFDTRLAFQCALSLGAFPPAAAVDHALAHIVLFHGDDAWVRAAVTLGAGQHPGEVLVALLEQDHALPTDRGECDRAVRALAELVGATGDPDQMERCVQAMTKSVDPVHVQVWRACVLGLAEGYQRHGRRWSDLAGQWSEASGAQLKRVFEEAAAGIIDPRRRGPSNESLALMEFAPWDLVRLPLVSMATRSPVVERRTRAIDVLGRRSEPEVIDILLMNFAAQTPAVKPSLLAACSRAPDRMQRLFDEIEAGRISAREIDPARANQLRNHRDTSVRERARKLLVVDAAEDRQKVLADYQSALTLKSDHRRGREVFVKNCVQCHRIADLGVNVAPDISDSRVKKPEQLLADILDPNRAIDNNYFSYSIVDTDGGVHTGVISAETATSITLRQPEGKELTLLRRNIEELKSSGVSLMPVGLEQKITVQEMADLISFIKNWRYLDGSVPPEVIRE